MSAIKAILAPNHAHFFFDLVLSSELPLRRDKPVGGEKIVFANRTGMQSACFHRLVDCESAGCIFCR